MILFTVEVLTLDGLKRYLVLFVIELKTRYIHIAGIHPVPDAAWMEQMARNLTDPDEGFLRASHHLIHDRDPLYTSVFEEILRSGGVHPVRLPARSPNLQCLCGAICPVDQGRVPQSRGPAGGGPLAPARPRVCGALPSGAESSGA